MVMSVAESQLIYMFFNIRPADRVIINGGVRGLIGKLAVNELSKVNPTAHTTQSVANL